MRHTFYHIITHVYNYVMCLFFVGNLPMYLLVSLLYQEAQVIPTQVKLIKEGKLRRHQRRQTTKVQGQLQKLWDRYGNREISTNSLLKYCARIYGPC